MKDQLICITCPMGCILNIEKGKELLITGNKCSRGAIYAKNELLNPKRTITSSVRIDDGEISMISVKTNQEIPKDKIKEAMKEIHALRLKAPIAINDVILDSIANTNVSLVATKTVKAC